LWLCPQDTVLSFWACSRGPPLLVPNGRSLFFVRHAEGRPKAGVDGQGKLLRGGNCTCTPLLASFVAACSSPLTAFVSPVTPLLTPRHANGLSLSIRN